MLGTAAVDAFLRDLDHPLKSAVEAIRAAILGVSPSIGEEIKWKSPSFHLKDHFATINVGRRTKARSTDHILVILHRGAKPNAARPAGKAIRDPNGLLEWLATDRGVLMFQSLAEVEANREALQDIVLQWIDT
ncbi:MAG: DUF1801 domain-containing protein [Gemmatimonadales bacterium]